ncbi:putative manganese catalase [Pirellula sp. SH-Sr6A]|uniref:manganese catalase family protein n=1 Tax=Pirellula sp. SH-Sr6A TaxID=1632865 RepID=UPI00078C60EB|nr:manganese catalase family protein [Pirellula sp. SH-Sr6A]AMV31513.1 putative manganese catalase [Pirellula sp. SH-Sr6A]
MFQHVKDLQFNVRVTEPDPKFANLLLEQFGGGNGELKAALQYFIQAFGCRHAYPDKYDLLMDIATEEFSHLEIVGATITLLLDGVSSELKGAAEGNLVAQMGSRSIKTKDVIAQAIENPHFLLESGGGPLLTDCRGVPWTGSFINANGDLTVDLRSNIGAESRAKIVYENLLKFTDDPYVHETLRFLMTREIAHFQQFAAALETIQPNFPPANFQGDVRFTHSYFNMSQGEDARGPWNEGNGPWPEDECWEYIDDPQAQVKETNGQELQVAEGNSRDPKVEKKLEKQLVKQRSTEVKRESDEQPLQWSVHA